MHFMFDSKVVSFSQTRGLERLHATVGHAACTRGGVAPAHSAPILRPNILVSLAQTLFPLLLAPEKG